MSNSLALATNGLLAPIGVGGGTAVVYAYPIGDIVIVEEPELEVVIAVETVEIVIEVAPVEVIIEQDEEEEVVVTEVVEDEVLTNPSC